LRLHRMNWAWLILCALAWPSAAAAQEWPVRPVRVIVPVSAGARCSTSSRFSSASPSSSNTASAPAVQSAAAGVAKAEPDGYTVLAHSAAIAVSVHTVLNAGYAARDFA
jgi:tripartite-type tricarboxylate transporter receptor subunit TctC